MFQQMKKRIKNEKGLTLIELLAVIVILAIIAVIAIPAIGNIIDNSRIKAVKADAVNIINAANMYYSEGNTAPFTGEKDAGLEFIQNKGKITKITSVTKAGEITAVGTAGSKTVTFTSATIKDIEPESPKATTKVSISGETSGNEGGENKDEENKTP